MNMGPSGMREAALSSGISSNAVLTLRRPTTWHVIQLLLTYMIVYDWTKSRFSGNPWGGWNPVSLASSRYKRLKASQEVVNTTPSGHCSCRSAATGPVPRIRTRSSLPFLSLVCSNENAPAFYDLREVSIPNEPSKNMITTSLDNPFTNIYVYIHKLSIQVDLPESVTMVLPFPISIDIFQDISGNSSLAPFHLPMLWTSMGNTPTKGWPMTKLLSGQEFAQLFWMFVFQFLQLLRWISHFVLPIHAIIPGTHGPIDAHVYLRMVLNPTMDRWHSIMERGTRNATDEGQTPTWLHPSKSTVAVLYKELEIYREFCHC